MNRRGLVAGLGALFVAAPAIVRVSSLMAMPRRPLFKTPFGFLSTEDIKRVIVEEYQRLVGIGLVERADLLASSIIIEQNELNRNQVDVYIRPVMVPYLKDTVHAFETAVGRRLGLSGSYAATSHQAFDDTMDIVGLCHVAT